MVHFAGKDIVARLRDAEPCADGYPCRAKEAKSGCCCAEAADTIESLRRGLDTRLAVWMTNQGYATGHGDTIEDMLTELDLQARARGASIGNS